MKSGWFIGVKDDGFGFGEEGRTPHHEALRRDMICTSYALVGRTKNRSVTLPSFFPSLHLVISLVRGSGRPRFGFSQVFRGTGIRLTMVCGIFCGKVKEVGIP